MGMLFKIFLTFNTEILLLGIICHSTKMQLQEPFIKQLIRRKNRKTPYGPNTNGQLQEWARTVVCFAVVKGSLCLVREREATLVPVYKFTYLANFIYYVNVRIVWIGCVKERQTHTKSVPQSVNSICFSECSNQRRFSFSSCLSAFPS